MRINLIFARASNGVIGRDGALPWHLPEDMAHFRRQTQGAPVVMGRKTWNSLPARFRPLPGRRNIVLSRQPSWKAEGAEVAATLDEALAFCETAGAPEVWIIGGAQTYAEAAPRAVRAVVTEIDQTFEGDAMAPALGPGWRETSREAHRSTTGLGFSFVTLER